MHTNFLQGILLVFVTLPRQVIGSSFPVNPRGVPGGFPIEVFQPSNLHEPYGPFPHNHGSVGSMAVFFQGLPAIGGTYFFKLNHDYGKGLIQFE